MSTAMKKSQRSASELFLESALRDGRANRQEMSIAAIRVDPKYQSRVSTNPEHVKHLAGLMDMGIELRPIVVFREPGKAVHRLADGFHRIAAHKAKRLKSISAYVIEGTTTDVVRYSAGANLENSKPTTAEDRRKALRMLLMEPELRILSNADLSPMCGITHQNVGRLRKIIGEELGISLPEILEITRNRGGTISRYTLKPNRSSNATTDQPTGFINRIDLWADRILRELTAPQVDELIARLTKANAERGELVGAGEVE